MANIELMDDMHLESQDLFAQYYNALSAGNITQANNILDNNPELANQITEADIINALIQGVNEREKQPKTDIDDYLDNLYNTYSTRIDNLRNMGTWDTKTQYETFNLVYYNDKGYFVYSETNPPIGTLPTDTTYWQEYDIKGDKGFGGLNLSLKYAWSNNVSYSKGDIVIYKNKLWYAVADNTNYEPNFNHYPWVVVSMPKPTNITPIQKDEPNTNDYDTGDFWWKVTEGEDVVQETWDTTSVETTPRFASASFTINDKIYVVGGTNSSFTIVNDNECFNPTTQTWSSMAALPSATTRAAGFKLNNKGYVVGGINTNEQDVATAECYDPDTNTWSSVADMPKAGIPVATATDSLGYVLIGETITDDGVNTLESVNSDFYSYNASSNTWTALTAKATGVRGSSLETDGSNIYAIGGMNSSGTILNAMEIYNIANNTWSTGESMNNAKCYLGTFYGEDENSNSCIFAFGGIDTNWYSSPINEKYDITNKKWTIDIPLKHPRSSLVGEYAHRHGYAIGGINMASNLISGYNERYGESPNFEMTINTALSTADNATTITMPFVSGGIYNCYIDWGDGTIGDVATTYNDGAFTHTYSESGEYIVQIYGDASILQFTDTIICGKVETVSICKLKLNNMSFMFGNTDLGSSHACTNMTSINLNGIDVQNVKSMVHGFDGCKSLKEIDVSPLSTATPIDINSLFKTCTNLTQIKNLSSLNLSANKSYYALFAGCSSLEELDCSGFYSPNCTSMFHIFYNCNKLKNIKGLENFDTSNVTNINGAFNNCNMLEDLSNISNWDTSKVTDMSYLFYNCNKLTILDLSNWNMLNTTAIQYMFTNCNSLTTLKFPTSITISPVSFSHTFEGCTALTGLDVSMIDASKVTTFQYAFNGVNKITTLDISNWDTSSATDMASMFSNMSNLTTIYASSNFVTTAVTNSTNMFYGDTKLVGGAGTTYSSDHIDATYAHIDSTANPGYFTSAISESTFSKTATSFLSGKAISFQKATAAQYNSAVADTSITMNTISTTDSPIATYGWIDSSNNGYWYSEANTVYLNPTCTLMFASPYGEVGATTDFTTLTTIDLTGLNSDKVTGASAMFLGAINLTSLNLGTLSFANNKYLAEMFYGCEKLTTIDISNFNTTNTTYIAGMFSNCRALTSIIGLNSLDTQNVTSAQLTFQLCDKLTSIDVSNWNTSNMTNIAGMFYDCEALTELNVSNWDTKNVTNMNALFYSCKLLTTLNLSNWDTSKVTNMAGMFDVCNKLTNIVGISNFDTSSVTNMSTMFQSCLVLVGSSNGSHNILDLSSWNTKNVTDMSYMFAYCDSLQDIGNTANWDTSKVTNMEYMFAGCDGTYITESRTFSNWDTSKVTDMQYMFYSSNAKLSKPTFDTSSVTNMSSMFYGFDGTGNLLDLSSFDTSNVTNMSSMFQNCTASRNLNLANWDTSKVTNMSQMFYGNTNLERIWVDNGFVTTAVTNSAGMFTSDNNLKGNNYDDTYYDLPKDDDTYAYISTSSKTGGYLTGVSATFKSDISSLFTDSSASTTKFVATSFQKADYETYYEAVMVNSADYASMSLNTDDSLAPITGFRDTGEDGGDSFWYSPALIVYLNESCSSMFAGSSMGVTNSLQLINLTGLNSSKVTNMANMFASCAVRTITGLDTLDTSNVNTMTNMFSDCENLSSVDLSNFDTSNVTDTGSMFSMCSSLTSLDLSSFNTSKVINMASMFDYCSNLVTIYASNKFVTTGFTSSIQMFYDCNKLVGGNGTKYSESNDTSTYARIDTASTPGYFTQKS